LVDRRVILARRRHDRHRAALALGAVDLGAEAAEAAPTRGAAQEGAGRPARGRQIAPQRDSATGPQDAIDDGAMVVYLVPRPGFCGRKISGTAWAHCSSFKSPRMVAVFI